MNGPGPEQGSAGKTGTARLENGWLQLRQLDWSRGWDSTRAECRKGAGAERGRVNPFDCSELVDQPRCHLNPHLNCPALVVSLDCIKLDLNSFGAMLHTAHGFLKDAIQSTPGRWIPCPQEFGT